MHKELLLKAFEKVCKKLRKEGIKDPSISKCATGLSDIISESFPFGSRRLRDFYNKAKNENEGDINIPQQEVLLAMTRYLGYESYADFVISVKKEKSDEKEPCENILKPKNTTPNIDHNRKKRKRFIKIVITVTFLLALLCYAGSAYLNRQQWMVWQSDHYELVSFDVEKLKSGSLKLYNEDRYEHLKKIEPNCSTQFFNADGSVRIWYGKNKNGKLEYFTALAAHPGTGKSLKPITQYMVDKHICN